MVTRPFCFLISAHHIILLLSSTATLIALPNDGHGRLLLAVAQVSEQQQFLVRASFLEIYNEEVRDLLSKNPKNKLDLKERKDQGIYVKGLNSFVVKSVAEITSVLEVRLPWRHPAILPFYPNLYSASAVG